MPIWTPRRSTPARVMAWAGALAFVASLIWFLYCYLVRFGMPAPNGSLARSFTIDVALFSVFALHHSALARTRAKRWIWRIVPAELERCLYTWIASLLFFVVCTWWQPVPGVLYQVSHRWRVGMYIVQAAGILLTIRAASAIDVLDLAGVRPLLVVRSGAALRHVPLETTGVFGFVRHPIYFGWVLFVFGAPHMTGTRFVFAAVSTAYLALAIPWEERGLIEIFGTEYERYRKRVRWRLVPWVY